MNKLLVVIDYQNDFVVGSLGFKKAESLEDGIYNKINEYLKEDNKVIFTYDTHYDNYLETREGINLPVSHCLISTEGHKLYGKLNEFMENKNTFHYNKESFGLSPESMIKISNEVGNDFKEIEFVGIVTNMCVISNIVIFQSVYTNASLVVDGSLCSSFDIELHNKALDVIESLQVNVINRGDE